MNRLLRVLVAALLVVLSGAVLGQSATLAAPEGSGGHSGQGNQDGPVIVVMDTSGSMEEPSGTGNTTRLDEARDAVLQTVAALPPNSDFGLIAYPGVGAREVDGCSIGNEEVRLGPLDQVAAATAVRRLTADGDTPTGPALQHAAELLKRSTNRGTIILVSDGESNCGSPDVCTVAQQLSASGVEVTAHTVGFHISDEGRDELSCVANTLGGRYVDITRPGELPEVLEELSGARLQISVNGPPTMPEVVGTGQSGSNVVVSVRNTGNNPAQDVRISVDFRDTDNKPGSLNVPRPVRFLGNLASGDEATTISIPVRPGPNTAGRYTGYVYVSAANTQAQYEKFDTEVVDRSALSGILRDSARPVIMGDSYSAGLGTGDDKRDEKDGIRGSGCSRSEKAWGFKLFQRTDIPMLACSGGVTGEFWSPRNAKRGIVLEPQLEQLRWLAANPSTLPDAVLLSIGGNDVGFVSLAITCISRGFDTCKEANEDARGRMEALSSALMDIYREIDLILNRGSALENRNGREAPIVIVPYPNLFPNDEASVKNGCVVGVSKEEVGEVRTTLKKLNGTSRGVINALQREGVPIYQADDVVDAFQNGHTVCDDGDTYAESNIMLGGRALHPNAGGHDAMARAIASWSASQTPVVPGSGQRPPKRNYVDTPVHNRTDTLAGTVVPSTGGVTQAGGTRRIESDGWLPNEQAVVRVASFPRVVASVRADENGRISQEVIVPVDTAAGSHHIEVVGFDRDGNPRTESQSVYVMPRYASLVIAGIVIGLILIITGAILTRRAKRRRKAKQARALQPEVVSIG